MAKTLHLGVANVENFCALQKNVFNYVRKHLKGYTKFVTLKNVNLQVAQWLKFTSCYDSSQNIAKQNLF